MLSNLPGHITAPQVRGLTVERVPLSAIREDPSNARAHGSGNLAAIRDSLARFGQAEPLLLQQGTDILVAGHGRLASMRSLGWTECEIVRLKLDEQERAALALALNRTAELAEWDIARLNETLAALPADLAALTGFDEQEMRKIAREAEMAIRALTDGVDPDAVPEPPAVPVTKPGDLWILGEHRLVCGDSTDPATVARVLQGDQPRLLVTDPPYGVSLDMEWRDRAGHNALGPAQASYMRSEGHTNTAISGDTRADWSEAFELVPSLDVAYVWHASAYAIEVGLGLRRIGFEIKQQIIWRKPQIVLSRQHYHWQHEPCWYARKPGSDRFLGSRDQSTIWEAASPKMIMSGAGEQKHDHPTQKPLVLMTRSIENHLAPGELVYEPFGGSGTTLAAAEVTRTRCRCVELDPKYCDVIVARWEGISGRKAERA